MPVLYALLGLLVLFLFVIVIRAAAFRPAKEKMPQGEAVAVDASAAAEHLAEMIRIPTVSSRDAKKSDPKQFAAFRALLPVLYPKLHAQCTRELVGPSGLLYLWKGKNSANPTVLMAHYDVVPVNAEDWQKPPFDAEIDENGVMWGRGTLDTKSTLCSILEAAEALIKEGFVPENDIYLSFSGDEEIMGTSAPAIVDELERRGVKPALVLDEGGAIVEGVFPGVKTPCAVVGIAEKGMMDLAFTVKSKGGHASSPPPHTPVGVLAQAVTRIENHPFKAILTPPAAEMFDTLGRHSTFAYRILFANLWCFLPLLKKMCTKTGGELNALLRTTCAFTMMEGSTAYNVLPPKAQVGANLRLMRGDTTETAMDYIRSTIDDPSVEVSMVYGMNPSPYADTKSPQWAQLRSVVGQTWPDVIVSPYLMVACSDSRHFCRICDNVFRFSAMELTSEERAAIHGANERFPVHKLAKTVEFYNRFIRRC